ncbi:MAG: hypothetical protein NVS4B8_00350 [Herpetosiphon sp.]
MASGVDYLSQLDDAFRSVGFTTNKPGVANRSWHKAGRAIDLSQWFVVQGQQGIVFLPDPNNAGLWRALLRCARQDGTLGRWYDAQRTTGYGPAAYYIDVTTILENEGWTRIGSNAGVTEAWHYELHSGLTWYGAMEQLYAATTLRRFFP